MTDEDLAAEICPDDPAEGLRLIGAMHPNKRAVIERMIAVADELNLHAAGLGPSRRA